MRTLMDAVCAAEQRGHERASREVERFETGVELFARRLRKLQDCLTGFDAEIGCLAESCFPVGLKHPAREATWLGFVVTGFSPDDDPVFPEHAHEIRVRAGEVIVRKVPLTLAAIEYVTQHEQE